MSTRKPKQTPADGVTDYRYETARRKNNPPAGIAGQGKVREVPKLQYAYDPHRPPVLRSDGTGDSDLARERRNPAGRRLSSRSRSLAYWLSPCIVGQSVIEIRIAPPR